MRLLCSRRLILIIACLCMVMMLTGCLRMIPLYVTNDTVFPVDVYCADVHTVSRDEHLKGRVAPHSQQDVGGFLTRSDDQWLIVRYAGNVIRAALPPTEEWNSKGDSSALFARVGPKGIESVVGVNRDKQFFMYLLISIPIGGFGLFVLAVCALNNQEQLRRIKQTTISRCSRPVLLLFCCLGATAVIAGVYWLGIYLLHSIPDMPFPPAR